MEELQKIRDAIIYCRVSSDKQQEGVSLEVQEKTCRYILSATHGFNFRSEYCSRQGLNVLRVYSEVISAKDIEKQKMLLDILETDLPEEAFLVVYNVSRFSRNVTQGLQVN